MKKLSKVTAVTVGIMSSVAAGWYGKTLADKYGVFKGKKKAQKPQRKAVKTKAKVVPTIKSVKK